MGCLSLTFDDGKGHAIVCSRGGRPSRAPCAFCQRAVYERLCDYVAPGRKRSCSARMCPSCATSIGDDRDLCPTHARVVREARATPELLADPHPDAMRVVADLVEQAGVPSRYFRPRDREEWEEFVCERAAIAEYVGGLPRAAAEQLARELAGPAPGRYRANGPLFAGAR